MYVFAKSYILWLLVSTSSANSTAILSFPSLSNDKIVSKIHGYVQFQNSNNAIQFLAVWVVHTHHINGFIDELNIWQCLKNSVGVILIWQSEKFLLSIAMACVCVCVCMSTPRELIATHVKSTHNNWLRSSTVFQLTCMALAVDKTGRHGLISKAWPYQQSTSTMPALKIYALVPRWTVSLSY